MTSAINLCHRKNNTSNKCIASINSTGEQLLPVTTTLAINLSSVSTTQVNKKAPEAMTTANNLSSVSPTPMISYSMVSLTP
jgi:hypothetical protein